MLVKQKIVSGRRKLGLSTPQLAEMIDVNQGTINRYENGTIKTIPTDKLKRLAEVLGYSFEEFISGDPRYSMMNGERTSEEQRELDEDDELLINWFHRLSKEYRLLVKQFILLDSKAEY
jgi:transcriptional regulator with XRE-family HTH domain